MIVSIVSCVVFNLVKSKMRMVIQLNFLVVSEWAISQMELTS